MRTRAAALVAALLVTGCGSGSDLPPGAERTSYTVGGHELWGRCGTGEAPTVVYLHGLDGSSVAFTGVAASVLSSHPDTAQCAYDRVNAGQSAKAPGPRPLKASVEELHAFLAEANVEGPLVLVGASYGGLIAMAYAGAYPDDIEALVMADAPLPFETALFDDQVRGRIRANTADNAEHVDLLASYAAAARARLPDVPFVYVDAQWQDLATQFGVEGYRPALMAYLDSLPQGELVLSRSDHLGVVDSRELVGAIEQLLS